MDGANVDEYNTENIPLADNLDHSYSMGPDDKGGNNTSDWSSDASLPAPSNLTLVYDTDVPQSSNGIARSVFHMK